MENTRIWAAAVFMFGGVSMAIVGGCFLVGVMTVILNPFCAANLSTGYTSSPIELSQSQQTFLIILYILAFTSFSTAGMLIFRAVKRLNH